MNHGDIADSLYCLGAACAGDLPGIEYEKTVFKKGVPLAQMPREKAIRRPNHWDCDVYSFPQTWSHGSLGFGGMGTAAYVTAQTTVIQCGLTMAAVYYGRQLAYVITKLNRQKLFDDIRAFRIARCEDAEKYGNVHSYGSAYSPKPEK